MKTRGVTVTSSLALSLHVQSITSSCGWTLYGPRVLHFKQQCTSNTLQSWCGYCANLCLDDLYRSDDWQQILSVVHWSKTCYWTRWLWNHPSPPVVQLYDYRQRQYHRQLLQCTSHLTNCNFIGISFHNVASDYNNVFLYSCIFCTFKWTVLSFVFSHDVCRPMVAAASLEFYLHLPGSCAKGITSLALSRSVNTVSVSPSVMPTARVAGTSDTCDKIKDIAS